MDELSATAVEEILTEAKAVSAGRPPAAPQPKQAPGQAARPAPQVEKAAAAPANPESEVEEPAEGESATEDAGEPGSAASVPDASWIPEDVREAYEQASPETREFIERHLKKNVMLEADYTRKNQRRAQLEQIEKDYLAMVGDPAAWLEFKKSRAQVAAPDAGGKAAAPADDPYPDIGEYDDTKKWAADVRAWTARENKRAIDSAFAERDKPTQRQRAIDEKSWAFRETLGAKVTDEEFEDATAAFAQHMKSKGKDHYEVLEAVGDVALLLAPYLALAKRTSQTKQPEAKPAPLYAKAASPRGQSASAKTKEVPVWELENREPTSEEYIAEAKRQQARLMGDLARARSTG